jgi:hypothetical protein
MRCHGVVVTDRNFVPFLFPFLKMSEVDGLGLEAHLLLRIQDFWDATFC